MPFAVILPLNDYHASNKLRFATEQEANDHAANLVALTPSEVVYTVKLINKFTGQVTVTTEAAADLEPEPEPPAEDA